MKRSRLPIAVAALVVGPLLTAVPAHASAGIDWKPCADKPEVECATLAVPVDWDKPYGDKIELALARRKAAAGADKLGTLMYGPGGPGGEGAMDLKRNPIFADPIYQRYDVISHDSRGIGGSSPIMCDTANEIRDWPATAEQFDKQLAQNKAYIEDCRQRTGPIFDHVDTISDVKDMDAIRAALGEKKLNYYGVSYGTLRGQQYAELFPHRVGRLVLDSTMDHSIDNSWDFMRTETYLREEMFGKFTAWCKQETTCALHGRDIPALMKQLYDKAAKGELSAPGNPTIKLNPVDFALTVEWRVLSETWAALADYIKSFEQGAPVQLAAAPLAPRNEPSRAIWCNDWDYRINSFDELSKLTDKLAKASPNVRFTNYNTWAVVCLGWPAKPTNPPHKLKLSKKVPPILITNSRYDPATVYPWAKAVAKQSKMPLVTYDGGGHGMYFEDSCSRDYIHNYLLKGDVPPKDTHCAVQPAVNSALPRPQSLTDVTGFSG